MENNSSNQSNKKDLIKNLLEAYKEGLYESVQKEIEAKFVNQIALLQEEIESLQSENTGIVNDLEKMRHNADFFEEEQELFTSEHALIKFQLSECQEENDALRKKAHILIEKEKHLQASLLSLKKELKEQRLQMEGLITNITHENEVYKEKVGILDTDKSSLSSLLTEKDHTIADLQNKITDCIKQEIAIQSELTNHIHTNDTDRHSLEERIRELELALHEKDLTLSTQNCHLLEMEATLKEKESVVPKEENEKPLQSTKKVKTSAVSDLEKNVDQITKEKETLLNDMIAAQAKLQEKEDVIKTLKEEMTTLRIARDEEMQMVQALLKRKS